MLNFFIIQLARCYLESSFLFLFLFLFKQVVDTYMNTNRLSYLSQAHLSKVSAATISIQKVRTQRKSEKGYPTL